MTQQNRIPLEKCDMTTIWSGESNNCFHGVQVVVINTKSEDLHDGLKLEQQILQDAFDVINLQEENRYLHEMNNGLEYGYKELERKSLQDAKKAEMYDKDVPELAKRLREKKDYCKMLERESEKNAKIVERIKEKIKTLRDKPFCLEVPCCEGETCTVTDQTLELLQQLLEGEKK